MQDGVGLPDELATSARLVPAPGQARMEPRPLAFDIAHCIIPDQDRAIEDIFRGKVAYARIKVFFESRNAFEK